MAQGRFVTAINCMDGRVQEPVLKWMMRRFEGHYVDMITEPGPDKIMAQGPVEGLESIKARVGVSVNAHASRVVAIVAHHDCTGFPVSKEEHLDALRRCIEVFDSWSFPVRVLGLWVDESRDVQVVYDSDESVGVMRQVEGDMRR